MEFPVDLLADVSQAELEQLAHNYMNNLLYSNSTSPECLTLSDSTQVTVDISSVGFTPLYGSENKPKILALFPPTDRWTAVAVYLLDRWWAVDDILKTADPARGGAVKVETLGERVVLYILNRVIYRDKERTPEELPFLCHGGKDYAKILWKNGEAVGFYSVKPPGSLYNPLSARKYQLPVLDTIFVRKCHRGKGFGLQMLEDFVLSFKENCLGLRYPLPKSMFKVCEKYLCQHPGAKDRLWEVESIGLPTQRTNIASKIQIMALSAVSKTEGEVEMESMTTQIKETMESTVEIVEDVTVLRVTKEAELPVTARGRSSGLKRNSIREKMTEDESEKVIRIEDIEAETPREEQVSSQQKTEIHNVSELVLTEGMFSMAPVENGEDFVDTASKEEGPMSDKVAKVRGSQDELTLASTPEEPQVEDVATQHLNISHDSQITVENVASEIEEAKKEDTALLVISEEGLEKTAETLNTVGEGRVLRRRTVISTPTTKRKYTRHNQKMSEELEEEVVEVPEENEVSTTEVVEELDVVAAEEPEENAAIKEDVVTAEKLRDEENQQQLEEKQMTNEEETEKQEEAGIKDAVLSSTDPPCAEESDDEMDKPIVLQRRGLRSNMKPESTKQSKRHHHTEETDLGPAGPASEEKADEKATEKQEGEHFQLEQDKSVGQTEEKLSTEEVTVVEEGVIPEAEESVEDIIPATEVGVENHMEVQEDESTEPAPVMETEKEEEADDVMQEPAAVTATSGTVILNEVFDQAAFPVADEPHGKDSGCEIPNLQQATVILVDLKTTYHHQSMKVAEEMPAERECSTQEKEQAELRTTEEMDVSSCFAEEQTPVLEEDDRSKEDNTEESIDAATEARITDKEDLEGGTASEDGGKGETEEIPFIETRVLRSGRKILKESHQQLEEDNIGDVIAEEKLDEAETGTCVGGEQIEAMANDAVTIVVPVEEKNLSPSVADEERSSEEEEIEISTRALRSGKKTVTATPRHKTTKNLRKQVGQQEVENSGEEEPPVEIRTQTQGRISASVMPQGEPRRISKQIQEDDSEIVEEMGEKEEILKGETIKKTDKEREEEMEVEMGEQVNEEAASDSQEKLEPEIYVEEGKSVAEGGQDVVEERDAGASGEVCDERKDVMVAAADLVEEGETLSPKPASNSAIRTTSGEEAASAEEQQSEDPIPQPSDLQTLTVVLVDLKKTHHNAQEETVVVEECVEFATEGEEEQSKETKREEHVPAFAFGIEKTEREKGVEVEGFGGGAGDAIPVQDTEEVGDEQIAIEDEAKSIDEEEEVKEMRALRSKKQAVNDKSREKKDEEEKEETSEIGEDELHPDEQSCTRDTIHKQLQETEVDTEKGGEKRTAVEEREMEEEEKQAEEQKQNIEKKERSEVKDGTQQIENESEMGLEKVDTGPEEAVIESEEEQDNSTEKAPDEDTVVRSAAEEKTSEGEGEQSSSTSEVALSPAKEDETSQEPRGASHVEEVPVVETRVLRSGGKTVVVTARSKTTKTDEQEKEATREKRTEDEPTVERTFVRKGRRSTAAATPQHKSKRIRTQCETEEEEGEDQTTADDETQMEKAKAHESEDDSDEKKEATNREGSAVEKEESTEPEIELESVETVAEKETMEESAFSGTYAKNEQKETSGGECAEEALNTDEGNVTDDEKAPVVETRFLRSAAKAVNANPRTQATKSPQEENEMDKSSDKETRVLRKGRRSAPATPRYKAKRLRIQCETEEKGKAETEVDEESTGQEEKTEEEGTTMELGVKIDKDVEEVENEAEPAVGGSEQMNEDLTQEAAVIEKKQNSMAAVDEPASDTVEIEETNLAEETKTTDPEKSTAAAEMGSHTAAAQDEPLVTDQSEASNFTSRALRSKTKTLQATPRRRSRRQKDQGVVETQQQVEEIPEEEKTQEGQRLTAESAENRALSAKEQARTEEESAVGQESGPSAEDVAEEQAKETTKGKQLEVNSTEERLEPVVEAVESEMENVASETDEEVENASFSQENEEDEHNMSEEKVEPIVIEKRVLRGRTVPSLIITPQSKPKRHGAKARRSEEFLSDEEKSPQSPQERRLHKRKSAELTPTRKSKRRSRV